MSYQVLARKWRPKNFTEMVGQQHVLQGLTHAIEMERLHHAYLFTGTRGVGKTTIARVIAKCLNCEKEMTSKPCNQCQTCQEINEGRFIDLIEIDAASRTKVEDTRDLLDNVQYAPTRGRFKIYLIDEVHMLSTHSFNALLKTLEEPPEHVKFLLATTDPQKLPVTVLSRCLQFHLRNLTPDEISGRLKSILEVEKIESDAQALTHIARAANGSMRDGLSLLDQAIAFGQGEVKAEQVATMLGSVSQQVVADIMKALIAQDAAALFQVIKHVHEACGHYDETLKSLARVLHTIAVKQKLPNTESEEFDHVQISLWAEQFQPAVVQVLYQIAITSQRDLPLAPDIKTGFEMALLRLLAFKPLDVLASQEVSSPPVAARKVVQKPQADKVKAQTKENTQGELENTTPSVDLKSKNNIEKSVDDTAASTLLSMKNWHEIAERLPLNGMIKQFVNNASLVSLSDSVIVIQITAQHAAMASKLDKQLQSIINSTFNTKVALQITVGEHQEETPADKQKQVLASQQADAEVAIQKDPNVEFLQANFSAIIEPNSIEPIKN